MTLQILLKNSDFHHTISDWTFCVGHYKWSQPLRLRDFTQILTIKRNNSFWQYDLCNDVQ